MSFASRFGAAFQVSLASSIAYATIGTLLVSILAIPLLEILFSVLLAKDVGSMDVLRTAYASTLVGIGLGVCSGVVSKTATDRNLGVFQVVHEYRRVDLAYWLASMVMPVLLALPAGVASLAVITVMSGRGDLPVVARLALLVVCALLVGGLLGISMSGVGLALSDPYQGAAFAGAVVPVMAGVIVPVALFPQWLAPLSAVVPLSGVVDAVSSLNSGVEWSVLAFDAVRGLAWAVLGLLMVQIARSRLRAGHKFSVI